MAEFEYREVRAHLRVKLLIRVLDVIETVIESASEVLIAALQQLRPRTHDHTFSVNSGGKFYPGRAGLHEPCGEVVADGITEGVCELRSGHVGPHSADPFEPERGLAQRTITAAESFEIRLRALETMAVKPFNTTPGEALEAMARRPPGSHWCPKMGDHECPRGDCIGFECRGWPSGATAIPSNDCGKPLGKGVCRMPRGHDGPHMNMFRSEPQTADDLRNMFGVDGAGPPADTVVNFAARPKAP